MKRRLICFFLLQGFLIGLASAAEEVTITTYYPSPYGSYNDLTVAGNLRLETSSGSPASDGPQIEWRTTASRHWNIDQYADRLRLFTENSTNGAGAERVSILENGNVGIGTITPAFNLHIVGDVDPAGVYFDGIGATVAPNFQGRRARGTKSFPSAVWADDLLFVAGARGYGTSGWAPLSRASLRFYAAQNWTNTAQGTYMTFETNPLNSAGSVECVRIDAAGNVGIGSTHPDAALTVSRTTSPAFLELLRLEHVNSWDDFRDECGISFVSGGTGSQAIARISGEWVASSEWALQFKAYSGAGSGLADVMTLMGNGNVGIGTVDPQTTLQVLGTAAISSTLRLDYMAGVENYVGNHANGDLFSFTPGNSDLRLKKDIINIPSRLDVDGAIKGLRGVYFYWDTTQEAGKTFSQERRIGMIAQEVEKVLPELVTTDAQGYKHITYPEFTAFLVEVAKAQAMKLEQQEAKIEQLEQRLARLETREN